jgi:hypothetical protein
MQEPIVVHCQCKPNCAGWVRIEHRERDLVGTPGTRIVLPAHACQDDRIREIHSGYLVVASNAPSRH